MAVTTRRLWLGAVVLCLVSLLAFLPPRGSRGMLRYVPWAWYLHGWLWGAPTQPDSLVAENNRLVRALTRTAEEWRILGWRDSLTTVPGLIEAARGGDPLVLVRGPVAPVRVEALRARVADAWRRLPRHDHGTWTAVLIVPSVNSGPMGQWTDAMGRNEHYLLTAPLLEEGGCALVVSGAALDSGNLSAIVDAMAPCGWPAAFGPPGAGVRGWLRRAEWAPADGPAWAPGYAQVDWRAWFHAADPDALREVRLRRRWADMESARLAVEGRIAVAACLEGREGGCLAAQVAPAWERRDRALAGVHRPRWHRAGDMAVRVGLLRELLGQVGPDRFQVFWRSPAPVERSFREVVGSSMDGWIGDRVRARLGDGEESRVAPLLPGVLPLLVGLALVATAACAAVRREVA